MSTGRALLATLAWTALAGMTAPDVTGQARDPGAAQEVVRELFTALDERRWADAAALTDPAILLRSRNEALAAAESALEARSRASDWYPPDMPPEVRAWHEQQRGAYLEFDVPAAVFPKLMQMIAGRLDPEPEQ